MRNDLFILAFFALSLCVSGCVSSVADPSVNAESTAMPKISSKSVSTATSPVHDHDKTPTVEAVKTRTLEATAGISREESNKIVPLEPTQIEAKQQEREIVIRWRGTGEDIANYGVFRKRNPEEAWALIGRVASAGDNRSNYHLTDRKVDPDVRYSYAVKVFTSDGRESVLSEIVTVNTH